ncbi:TRAP transporter small permease [Microvirga terrae]|uniref:TRAP transporter small permease protein n=1 Tax=Microvirga terrae TaxID=2740529 RepID=A0ABY5RTL4_9HYPH|nr:MULTISPECIES: TRAP transporter small permease [Microvirga]MBQ0824715.1 TRAP transporter small permease [Microvirga sp. HBU67558]UVF20348.1 TRAP transporter small permease [Microvirga terrae]
MTTEVHTQVSAEELAQTFDESEHAPVDLSGYAFEDWLSLALFWAMSLAVFVQFFTRYVLNDSFAWTEEIATNLLVALVFIGSAMCVRMSRHIQVDFLYRYLSPGLARVLATLIDVIRVAFFAYGALLVWRFMSIIGDEQMTTIALPKNLSYAFVFIGFVLMFFRSVQVAVANWRRGYSVLERPEAFDAPLVAET